MDGQKSKETFTDLRVTFSEEQMKEETERCLGCGVCTTKCKFDAIHLERRYDSAGVDFSQMKVPVIKHAAKRQEKNTCPNCACKDFIVLSGKEFNIKEIVAC